MIGRSHIPVQNERLSCKNASLPCPRSLGYALSLALALLLPKRWKLPVPWKLESRLVLPGIFFLFDFSPEGSFPTACKMMLTSLCGDVRGIVSAAYCRRNRLY